MKCDKCKKTFDDKNLQLSHDIPKYMSGKDIDGRRYLCEPCHKEYEIKTAILIIKKFVPEDKKTKIKEILMKRARWYF